jgi:2-iminobutanoate/2-iminopropanoate deaminase
MNKEKITCSNAPAAIGPYSQAIRVGQWLFLSGQLPIHPVTGEIPDDIQGQTTASLENLKAILESSGASLSHVVKTTCFLSDMAHFPLMNEVYQHYFEDPAPARTTIAAKALPKDVMVEVDCIAFIA